MASEVEPSSKIIPPWPKLELPPDEPVTPEELRRRTVVVERILKRREQMAPLDITTDELIHDEREVEPHRYG